MKRPAATLSWICASLLLAAMCCVTVRAQDDNAPVTRVVPVTASPALAPDSDTPPPLPPLIPLPPIGESAPEATPPPAEPPPQPASAPHPEMQSWTTPVPRDTEPEPIPTPESSYSIEIDLTHQRAYLLDEGQIMSVSPISSGRPGHLTPTGNFSVIQKDLNHYSTLYGEIIDEDTGRVVVAGADSAMPVPKGCKFVAAPMKWFMRFSGASGMHAGILPGYPASHGCVRMPAEKAELFFNTVDLGSPVHVFGTPPTPVFRQVWPFKGRPGPQQNPTPKPHHFLWF